MIWGGRVRGKGLLTCKYACCQHTLYAEKKGLSKIRASSVAKVGLEGGGGRIASHAGLFVPGGSSDSLGLGSALCATVGHSGEPALFGRVASDTTAYRTLLGIDEECLERVHDAAAGVRARARP